MYYVHTHTSLNNLLHKYSLTLKKKIQEWRLNQDVILQLKTSALIIIIIRMKT